LLLGLDIKQEQYPDLCGPQVLHVAGSYVPEL